MNDWVVVLLQSAADPKRTSALGEVGEALANKLRARTPVLQSTPECRAKGPWFQNGSKAPGKQTPSKQFSLEKLRRVLEKN